MIPSWATQFHTMLVRFLSLPSASEHAEISSQSPRLTEKLDHVVFPPILLLHRTTFSLRQVVFQRRESTLRLDPQTWLEVVLGSAGRRGLG